MKSVPLFLGVPTNRCLPTRLNRGRVGAQSATGLRTKTRDLWNGLRSPVGAQAATGLRTKIRDSRTGWRSPVGVTQKVKKCLKTAVRYFFLEKCPPFFGGSNKPARSQNCPKKATSRSQPARSTFAKLTPKSHQSFAARSQNCHQKSQKVLKNSR